MPIKPDAPRNSEIVSTGPNSVPMMAKKSLPARPSSGSTVPDKLLPFGEASQPRRAQPQRPSLSGRTLSAEQVKQVSDLRSSMLGLYVGAPQTPALQDGLVVPGSKRPRSGTSSTGSEPISDGLKLIDAVQAPGDRGLTGPEQDAREIFSDWPKGAGAVTFKEEHVRRIVTDMGWDHHRVTNLLVWCTRQLPVSIDFERPEVERSLYNQLLASGNDDALRHMLFMMKVDPLTKKAMTSAMSRRKNPIAIPPVPSDAIKQWVPFYFARVDRPGKPDFVYIEQKRSDSPGQLPQGIRVFYGKAGTLDLVKLLQPMSVVQPSSPKPSVLDLDSRQPQPNGAGARPILYIDTNVGQMFIHPDFAGDFGFANIKATAQKGRRQSLTETALLYEPLRSQTSYAARTRVHNRFRELDGTIHCMTEIDLDVSHVEQLETWRRLMPSGFLAETLPITNDDGLRPGDLL